MVEEILVDIIALAIWTGIVLGFWNLYLVKHFELPKMRLFVAFLIVISCRGIYAVIRGT